MKETKTWYLNSVGNTFFANSSPVKSHFFLQDMLRGKTNPSVEVKAEGTHKFHTSKTKMMWVS